MTKTVTPKHAQAALEAVREQFSPYLSDGEEGPRLVKNWESDSGRTVAWAIVWDECAPHEWAMRAHQGGLDADLSEALGRRVETTPATSWPEEVWCEPYTGYVLALYPTD